MNKLFYILLASLLLCFSCEYKLPQSESKEHANDVKIIRYDRVECRYLTTGDFAALQQMNMDYPMETRTLIEDILKIGDVSEPNINSKFLAYFQDSTLQTLIMDSEMQYADISDIEKELTKAFSRLKKEIKGISTPRIYAQVGALNQSIVVGDGVIGISLDKYLGKDYELYKKYFTAQQREGMGKDFVVPDCICFYLLSLYPLENHDFRPQREKDLHIAKVMWAVNKIVDKKKFQSDYIDEVDKMMKQNSRMTIENLLKSK